MGLPLTDVRGAPGSAPGAAESLPEWIAGNRGWLRERLLEHGGVLFRGWLSGEPDEFEAFLDAAGAVPMRYLGGATPRSKVQGAVYTSTDAPPAIPIPFHNEMSYSPEYPRAVAFCCKRPAPYRGRTPLSDSRAVYEDLPDGLRERFESLGVSYDRHVPEKTRVRGRKTWPEMFETDDRDEVERICAERGIDAGWEDGSLRLRVVRPAAIEHPDTGDRIWFNQVNLYHHSFSSELRRSRRFLLAGGLRLLEALLGPRAPGLGMEVRYGDGSPIPRETVERIRDAYWRQMAVFPWEKGDLLVLDNLRIAHAREPYVGRRQLHASLIREWEEE
ncbi:MAG: TauD/TfdA family dioxygenase [Gemmatimonadota bacterium]|nr:TauD/TfdA family dioxygenase [Gemmatimonadota bacterium]